MRQALASALMSGLIGLLLSSVAIASVWHDPTAPHPGKPASGLSETTSHGLTWTRVTENRREAVIDGVKVTEGQRLGAMRIHRIRHGEVVIEQDDKRRTLRLQPTRIKQTP